MPAIRSSLTALTAGALVLAAGAAGAQTNTSSDMFPTRAAAEKRAQQLKCSGAFAMGDQWMPCQDLNSYEKAVSTKP
jgi:Protein of unknown function